VADGSPTVRRRRLGLILRSLRERAGLTGEEVGAAIERSGSWVSRVETGRVGLRGRDLTDLLRIYGVDDQVLIGHLTSLAKEGKQRGWWSRYADTLAGTYATYIGFESEAAELLIFEAVLVNGLLQTEDYARALFNGAEMPPNTADVVDRKVAVRLARQKLLSGPNPLKVWVILDESVLHRRIGGAQVQRAQLEHLVEQGEKPNVTIQVVPFDAGPHPGMIGSFTVVRFRSPDDPDIVYIEGLAGDIFAESEDATRYHDVFDHLRAAALSPVESRQMINDMRDGLSVEEDP
jgi:transcriptional regulator with XRE-family HTH domain